MLKIQKITIYCDFIMFAQIFQIGTLEDHYLFEIPNRQKRSTTHSQEHHNILESHSQVSTFLLTFLCQFFCHQFEMNLCSTIFMKKYFVFPSPAPFSNSTINPPLHVAIFYPVLCSVYTPTLPVSALVHLAISFSCCFP